MTLGNSDSIISSDEPPTRWRPSSKTIAGGLLALPLVATWSLLEWPWGVRFTYEPFNPLFFALSACTVPVALFALAQVPKSLWLRRVVRVFALLSVLPVGVLAVVAAVIAVNSVPDGRDGMLTRIAELPAGAVSLRLYLSNCGATCAYGLVLRKEIDTPVGLQLYRSVWSKYRTDAHATLQRIDHSTVLVIESNGNSSRVPH